jgi:hypothetical protein
MWLQVVPFVVLTALGLIPGPRMFRRLGMSPAWTLLALFPVIGWLAMLYTAAYGKWAGAVVILLGLAGWIAVVIFGTPLVS